MKQKINIAKIKSNKNNPRFINDSKFKRLVKSIEEFPEMLEKRPIVVDENFIVLGGNMRLKACKKAGLKEIWIDQVLDWSEEKKNEFIIKDNSGFGEWDWDILLNEWEAKDLYDWGLDIPEIPLEDIEAEEDNYEEPEELQVDVVLGDLIEIGEHRLLCGDSTDVTQVEKLMNGKKADMVFTDPPYGVNYQSNMRTKSQKFDVLENDNVFITEWINNLPLFSKGFVFVWTSWKVLKQWIEFCEHIGELSNLIIWNKGGGGIGDLKKTFSTDFEVALVYHRGAEIKGKRLGSVWSIGKDGSTKYLHPTQKPIELAAMAIENVSTINNLVLDLFLGSGSTMVAAHQLKRKCYGMELDPKYCQVIIDRMQKLDPDLEIKINNKVYLKN
jgi:DNA modification methylase|tara:strand:+ start:488 stop:1642 length:1155 start_codon:yes stop_codon:yes gene_type:complete